MLFTRLSLLLLLLASDIRAAATALALEEEEFVENSSPTLKRHNEFVLLEGHKIREKYHSPLPYTYIAKEDLPVSCACAGRMDRRAVAVVSAVYG